MRRSSKTITVVAFTPKGGCPFKLAIRRISPWVCFCSIHPQGWVPIETATDWLRCCTRGDRTGSIHPQGWVPIETGVASQASFRTPRVAFTPKGGCPLKRAQGGSAAWNTFDGSIHPQGWVPIETTDGGAQTRLDFLGSIHPQGWVLIRVQASDTKSLGQVRSFALTPLAPLIIPIAQPEFVKARMNENPLLKVPPASRGNRTGARLGSPREAGGTCRRGAIHKL